VEVQILNSVQLRRRPAIYKITMNEIMGEWWWQWLVELFFS